MTVIADQGLPVGVATLRSFRMRDAAARLLFAWRRSRSMEAKPVCNLYSIMTNQAAIITLFRVRNRYVGNLPPMPGVFPDYPAPVVRNTSAEREIVTMRWGMPPPPRRRLAIDPISGPFLKRSNRRIEAEGRDPLRFGSREPVWRSRTRLLALRCTNEIAGPPGIPIFGLMNRKMGVI